MKKSLEQAVTKILINVYRQNQLSISVNEISFDWKGDDYVVNIDNSQFNHSYNESGFRELKENKQVILETPKKNQQDIDMEEWKAFQMFKKMKAENNQNNTQGSKVIDYYELEKTSPAGRAGIEHGVNPNDRFAMPIIETGSVEGDAVAMLHQLAPKAKIANTD